MSVLKGKRVWLVIDNNWLCNSVFSCYRKAKAEMDAKEDKYINEGYEVTYRRKGWQTSLKKGESHICLAIMSKIIDGNE